MKGIYLVKPVVYIDMLFLLNFLMNSVTLYASSMFLRKRLGILKLALTASFSALYSSVMFFPQLSFLYSAAFKSIFLILIAWLAFPSKKFKEILKSSAVFLTVNLIFGGAVFALIFATDFGTAVGSVVSNGEIYLNLSFGTLLASTIPAYITICVISYIRKQNIKNERLTAEITLSLGGKMTTFKALCDTGCTLCDPISGAPAIIISRQIADKISDNLPPERYRIIPFSTIDNEKSFMDGFIPDKISVGGTDIYHCVIAVTENKILDYEAIFNPDLMENISLGKAVNIKNETETTV